MATLTPSVIDLTASPQSGLPHKEARQKRLTELTQEIAVLKKQRNAVILAHLYERIEIQNIADHVGDSLGLSQEAASTDAEVIIFCGVHFMAETAKILSPNKKVFLGNRNAGCPMADMITREELIGFKAKYPGVPVVAYVNTSADVKAESDVCCTSANAVNVVRALNTDKILCVPDEHLARYIQSQVPEVEVIWWDGFCPTHLRMRPEDVEALKKQYPDAMVLAHPECDDPIKNMADFIGSTTKIRQTAIESTKSVFIVCTEDGVRQRLEQDCPDKLFMTPTQNCAVCPNMKLTRLENIRNTLLNLPVEDEILIDPSVREKAKKAIDFMMEISA
jgi:quinolinate synthase